MKDHVREGRTVDLCELEGPPSEVSAKLLRYMPEDAVDARFEIESGYYGAEGAILLWWRPMTEKEKERAKEKRKKEREARKAEKERAEAAERAEYERLKAKFG